MSWFHEQCRLRQYLYDVYSKMSFDYIILWSLKNAYRCLQWKKLLPGASYVGQGETWKN